MNHAYPSNGASGTPLRVGLNGSAITVHWDANGCFEARDYQIIYGEGTDLPGTSGDSFDLMGSECSIGTATPYVWNDPPTATDGTGLVWFLVTATNGIDLEGSWGTGSDEQERNGPVGGSSGECDVIAKDTTNTCGQ